MGFSRALLMGNPCPTKTYVAFVPEPTIIFRVLNQAVRSGDALALSPPLSFG
jgi:hypothetical protein